VLQAGEQLTETILCSGNGFIFGWIDFNRNLAFDPDERSQQSQCIGGEAVLTWDIPQTLTAGGSVVRLRYSNDLTSIQQPTGTAPDGEVEDHFLTIVGPSLAVTKGSNAQNDSWRVGESGAIYNLTVTNEAPVATGTADNNPPPAEITVLDQLPDGIVPAWTGIHNSNGWACGFAGQLVTCTSSQLIAASGQAGDSSQIDLPVEITETALGEAINHASVGGGRDPYNGGVAPTPGDSCTDADHCAAYTVTIQPAPVISTAKSATPASGTDVPPGGTITFTIDTTVGLSATTSELTLSDTLGDGLTFGAITAPGPFSCTTSGQVLTCTLPENTVPGTYRLTYTATVDADAIGTVTNTVQTAGGGDPEPECTNCSTTHPVLLEIAVAKTSDPGNGAQVAAGQTITYTLTATVTGSATTDDLMLTDTLGAGLTFDAVTEPGSFSAGGTGQTRTFTLPAGTPAGSYVIRYTAIVNDQAAATVGNSVAVTQDGGNPDPDCANCSTEHPLLLDIDVQKTSTPAAGTQVKAGDILTYTLTATVSGSVTTADLVLTDTLGDGLTFGSVTDTGSFTAGGSGQQRIFTLPAGTPEGTYTVSYTATVNDEAAGTIANNVAVTNGGGASDPQCANCSTEHPLLLDVAVEKSSDPAEGALVEAGQTITYTLTAMVTGSATTEEVVLTDTLEAGLTFGAVTNAGSFTASGSGQERIFTLPAGTPAGIYSVTYTAVINDQAGGAIGNSVVVTNGGGDPSPECAECTVRHPLHLDIATQKTSSPASGTEVQAGNTITYTLTATVTGSATTEPLVLTDTLGAGLTFDSVTDAGSFTAAGSGQQRSFTLPTGTPAGTYAVSYTAIVNEQAAGSVRNDVQVSTGACTDCSTEHPLLLDIAVQKTADPANGTQVQAGDAITYTLTATLTGSAICGRSRIDGYAGRWADLRCGDGTRQLRGDGQRPGSGVYPAGGYACRHLHRALYGDRQRSGRRHDPKQCCGLRRWWQWHATMHGLPDRASASSRHCRAKAGQPGQRDPASGGRYRHLHFDGDRNGLCHLRRSGADGHAGRGAHLRQRHRCRSLHRGRHWPRADFHSSCRNAGGHL